MTDNTRASTQIAMPPWWSDTHRFAWRLRCNDTDSATRLAHESDFALRLSAACLDKDDAEYAGDLLALRYEIARSALSIEPVTADLATGREVSAPLLSELLVSEFGQHRRRAARRRIPAHSAEALYALTHARYLVACLFAIDDEAEILTSTIERGVTVGTRACLDACRIGTVCNVGAGSHLRGVYVDALLTIPPNTRLCHKPIRVTADGIIVSPPNTSWGTPDSAESVPTPSPQAPGHKTPGL